MENPVDPPSVVPPYSGIHQQELKPLSDGRYRAVTIFNKGASGILVWLGFVPEGVVTVEPGVVNPRFVITERVSFMFWDDVLRYFKDHDYAPLIGDLRRNIPKELRAWDRR